MRRAVEPAGRLQRRDRADVGDRLARHFQRWRQPGKLRMRVSFVDLAPLQGLPLRPCFHACLAFPPRVAASRREHSMNRAGKEKT